MSHARTDGQGRKTHEQFLRTLEHKDDVPKAREIADAEENLAASATRLPRHREARDSELPVSRRGMNQESDHNKHNDPGQAGHKPQKHSEAEEKQHD
jgi:hypothetical protein